MKWLNKLLKNQLFLGVLVIVLLAILWKCVSTIEGMSSSDNVFKNSSVPDSTPSTFKSDLGDTPKLVWFYAHWCGHCKNMLSDWDKLALEDGKGNSAQEALAKEYDVSAYPTILIIDGASATEFEGERSYSGLKQALP